jgi:hypothetical protein
VAFELSKESNWGGDSDSWVKGKEASMREQRVRVGGMVVSLAGRSHYPKCGAFAVALCWTYYWTSHNAGRLRG